MSNSRGSEQRSAVSARRPNCDRVYGNGRNGSRSKFAKTARQRERASGPCSREPNMTDHVISVRLPAAASSALRTSAGNAHLSVPAALDWLLRYSFGNFELLRTLPDSCEWSNSKLDARIPFQTFEQLKLTSQKLGISPSVYVRRLLYNFYITKRVHYLKSDRHYTLAGRHD